MLESYPIAAQTPSVAHSSTGLQRSHPASEAVHEISLPLRADETRLQTGLGNTACVTQLLHFRFQAELQCRGEIKWLRYGWPASHLSSPTAVRTRRRHVLLAVFLLQPFFKLPQPVELPLGHRTGSGSGRPRLQSDCWKLFESELRANDGQHNGHKDDSGLRSLVLQEQAYACRVFKMRIGGQSP